MSLYSDRQCMQSQDKFLELNFRPGCPYSHPLFANRISTSNFLLTVKRTSASSEKYSCAITGLIPRTYAFRGMADFQCIVSRETFETETVEPKDVTDFDVPHTRDLKMIPTIFSPVDMPQNYNFETNPLFSKDKETGQWILKTKKKTTTSWNITGKAIEVPKTPPYALREDLVTVYKRLKELFETRPIWLQTALKMNVPKEMHSKIGRVLPILAYYFKSGPWRVCWVKLGYDPRKDPESYRYQTIDFRIPEQYVKRIKNKEGEDRKRYYQPSTLPRRSNLLDVDVVSIASTEKVEGKGIDLSELEQNLMHTFSRIPTHVQSFYQYIDINIEAVRKLVAKPHTKHSPRTGWLSAGTISSIRSIMMNQLKKLFKSAETKDPSQAQNEDEELEMEIEEGGEQKDSASISSEEASDREQSEDEGDEEEELEGEDELEEEEGTDAGAFSQVDFLQNLMKSIEKEGGEDKNKKHKKRDEEEDVNDDEDEFQIF